MTEKRGITGYISRLMKRLSLFGKGHRKGHTRAIGTAVMRKRVRQIAHESRRRNRAA